jgi:hypothetical protein
MASGLVLEKEVSAAFRMVLAFAGRSLDAWFTMAKFMRKARIKAISPLLTYFIGCAIRFPSNKE